MATVVSFSFDSLQHSVRGDIPAAFRGAWDHIARPGSAWNGTERVAIAEEARRAWECALCRERKAALSPNAVAGEHEGTPVLSAAAVDATHRISTDAGRLTKKWFDGLLSQGLTDVQYVEIIGIVSTVASIDAFCRGVGAPIEALPEPQPGGPTGYRPERLQQGGSWLPMLMEDDLAEPERELYGGAKQGANVLRAMSLVPEEIRNLGRIAHATYLEPKDVKNFRASGGRAISRPQMELIAARVSALNECFY